MLDYSYIIISLLRIQQNIPVSMFNDLNCPYKTNTILQLYTHSMIVAMLTRSDVQTVNIHASMFYAHLHEKAKVHCRHLSTIFRKSGGKAFFQYWVNRYHTGLNCVQRFRHAATGRLEATPPQICSLPDPPPQTKTITNTIFNSRHF